MKAAVIITTINNPTEAILKYSYLCEQLNYAFVVIGDQKTPKNFSIPYGDYLSITDQEQLGYKTLDIIPYNCYERKNIGYLYALKTYNPDYYISSDDDNIPLDNWIYMLDYFFKIQGPTLTSYDWVNFLPYFEENIDLIWPRGLPLHYIDNVQVEETTYKKIGIVAGLWNNSPDFDALGHLYYDNVYWQFQNNKYIYKPPTSLSPYNTQNTIFIKELLPYQFLFSGIGRSCDIWASYLSQFIMQTLDYGTIYISPTVEQKRNFHLPLNDFIDEKETLLLTERFIMQLKKVPISNNLQLYYKSLCSVIGEVIQGYIPSIDKWLEDINEL